MEYNKNFTIEQKIFFFKNVFDPEIKSSTMRERRLPILVSLKQGLWFNPISDVFPLQIVGRHFNENRKNPKWNSVYGTGNLKFQMNTQKFCCLENRLYSYATVMIFCR